MKSLFRYTFIFGIIISLNTTANAQWEQNFDGTELEGWTGDVDQFVINEANQLQLNAPDAGEALITRNSVIDADTVTIAFWHTMDFSPSDNNKSTIYLALDNEDISQATGYFIEIGENGSNDAIKFFYLQNGASEQIASAAMGAMANEPATVRIEMTIYPDGLWAVKTNYAGESFLSLDVEFVDNRFLFKDSNHFGIQCKFSASRADKFFYDDMSVLPFEQDRTPPSIASISAINSNAILVTFDEPIDLADALDLSNYSLDNGIGAPASINNQNAFDTQFELQFNDTFDSSIDYTLSLTDIRDVSGNKIEPFDFKFNFPASPQEGELLLSELLFNPLTGGDDFVEFYNPTSKYLQINGLTIRNNSRDESKTISSEAVAPPQSYIAVGENTDFLIQEYKPIAEANIFTAELPAFNNDSGNVMIINSDGIVLDSFDYSEELHSQVLDDLNGVSLERVDFDLSSDANENWQSASQAARFATPGYKNSTSISINPSDEMFEVLTETFSPNQDGIDDIMILSYNLEKNGFVANIAIHDVAGFKIRDISRNDLLGSKGIITWDGLNEEGNVSDIGIYIIVGEVFHPDGEVFALKKTTVLADFID